MTATDIVENPVDPVDRTKLQSLASWEFVRVVPERPLPFPDDSFDIVIHQDVIEHVQAPHRFVAEQFRVLARGGTVIVGTPNLLRPANVIKLMMGRLVFPLSLGKNEAIGEYVHVQEFTEWHLKTLLSEVGFQDVQIHPCYFGFLPLGLVFSPFPKNNLGRTLSHFLIAKGNRP